MFKAESNNAIAYSYLLRLQSITPLVSSSIAWSGRNCKAISIRDSASSFLLFIIDNKYDLLFSADTLSGFILIDFSYAAKASSKE